MSGLMDYPNREALGLDPPWAGAEGGEASQQSADGNGDKLPGQHAGLNELAEERGHTWSRDDLTVAEKQAELGGG